MPNVKITSPAIDSALCPATIVGTYSTQTTTGDPPPAVPTGTPVGAPVGTTDLKVTFTQADNPQATFGPFQATVGPVNDLMQGSWAYDKPVGLIGGKKYNITARYTQAGTAYTDQKNDVQN